MQPLGFWSAKRSLELLNDMNDASELIRAEITDLAAIVQAACAVEQAKRGGPVDPHDTAVQVRVADMILGGLGAHLRALHGGIAADAV